jgi:hypothetical protein
MAYTDRLYDLAHACVQAAHEVDDTETAALLLESAHRFLERANPELAMLKKLDLAEFNRRQLSAFQH